MWLIVEWTTVRFGDFLSDGLALLALLLDHCVTFCSPCDFLLIMAFTAILVSRQSPPVCVHKVWGFWSCSLRLWFVLWLLSDGRKLIIIISDFGWAWGERRGKQHKRCRSLIFYLVSFFNYQTNRKISTTNKRTVIWYQFGTLGSKSKLRNGTKVGTTVPVQATNSTLLRANVL